MTLKEIKALDERIRNLKAKVAVISSNAYKTTATMSNSPKQLSTKDKVGKAAVEIADIKSEIETLDKKRNDELSRLRFDVFEENCIFLHLVCYHTWRQVALIVDGRPDTADSIKKRCHRYSW